MFLTVTPQRPPRSQIPLMNSLDMQMSPIQQGLKDVHPYVRRTAVMGVLKVYNVDKGAVQRAGIAISDVNRVQNLGVWPINQWVRA